MNTDHPLVCNMGVFTPSQREAHIQNTTRLVQQVQQIQEVEHGYRFLFPKETELITQIAEFIANERLCCPFLRFQLTVEPESETIAFALDGPIGTQEFLREEFRGVFQ